MKRIAAIVILGSLALLSGCYDGGVTQPVPYEYDGYLELGWDCYQDQNFQEAHDFFIEAIDIDPSLPDAYVGAGWSSLYLPDYWRIADNYFYMAIQQQAGEYPLGYFSESQIQDTAWTVFQCVDPVLPDSVTDVIEALGETWYDWPAAGDTTLIDLITIGNYLYGAGPFSNFGPEYGDRDFQYRFQPKNSGVIAMYEAINGYTTLSGIVDSISGDWVYISVPLATMEISSENYYTWIGADEQINYEYRIFDQTGSPSGQYLLDAMAGSCMLQDIRGENGDALLASASAFALDMIEPNYSFGSGQIYAGLESLNNMQIKGTAAAVAFSLEFFKFAWYTCLSEGQGTGLDPDSATFVTDLMAVIETMLGS